MKWIKIEDENICVNEMILLYSEKYKHYHLMSAVGKRNLIGEGYTHWMPVPEPPEEELKCPLCLGIEVTHLSGPHVQYGKIWCNKCRLTLNRLTKDCEYIETEEQFINRWKQIGGNK